RRAARSALPESLGSIIRSTMSDPKKWLLMLALTSICVVISYEFLDRPIAFYVHAHVREYPIFARATQLPEFIAPLGAVVLLWLGIRALMQQPLSGLQPEMLLCCLSLVVTDALKRELKAGFGRTWPETWVRDNPSLSRDGVYGFNPFHGGPGFESFPSGHTTGVIAVMSVLWICYPRFRILYGIVIAAVVGGLIGADFHFLSDCIAGAFLGASTGWIVVTVWERGVRVPVLPDS